MRGLFSSDLYHATSFKLALTYLSVFTVSAVLLVGFVSWRATASIERQVEEVVEAEAGGLSERYRERGVPGLSALVTERVRQDAEHRSVYLLLAPDGTRIAGNLARWPTGEAGTEGWVRFQAPDAPGADIIAHSYFLPEGYDLMVGRSLAQADQVVSAINGALGLGLGFTVLLGVVGALVSSGQLARRVEAMSRAARRVIDGDIKSRMEITDGQDEFDRLAQSFNAMMDEIERLVDGIRTVTDNVAHDLRTPLNRMRSRIELAAMRNDCPPAVQDALERAIGDCDHLLGTFSALLAISEVESGHKSRAFKSLDPSELARDVAELYEPLAEERSVSLTVDLTPGLSVMGDPHLLFQAFSNIMDNSVKYTPQGGRIHLSVGQVEGTVAIIVGDSGPGIPKPERERVMERFVRLDGTRSTPGNGLGLSMVRAVAALHGATLHLCDNSPGLRVEFLMPLV